MTAPAPASTDPVRPTGAGSASALWRDVARAAAGDPGFVWALGLGVVLIALALLGFVPNPFVGAPSARWGTPLLVTGDSHDVVHLIGGAVALHAALGLSRARRDVVLVVLGAIALLLLALGILDGRWLGLLTWPVGLADQLLHLIVGLGSMLVGLAGLGAFEMGSRSTSDPEAVTASVTAPLTSSVTTPAAPEAGPSAAPAAEGTRSVTSSSRRASRATKASDDTKSVGPKPAPAPQPGAAAPVAEPGALAPQPGAAATASPIDGPVGDAAVPDGDEEDPAGP
jgi:hypothetical protein